MGIQIIKIKYKRFIIDEGTPVTALRWRPDKHINSK